MTKQIHTSMVQATKDFGTVGVDKNGTNSFQKFNYRSIDDIRDAANKILSRNNIHCQFQFLNSKVTSIGKDVKGTNVWLLEFDYCLSFINGEDGSSTEPYIVHIAVDGKDVSKLSGIASSYAHKTALINAFNIPLEGEDDVDGRDENGITMASSDNGKENNKGIVWSDAPKSPSEAIAWAAKMTGRTQQEAKDLLDQVQPDANGKKFMPFTLEVKRIWESA